MSWRGAGQAVRPWVAPAALVVGAAFAWAVWPTRTDPEAALRLIHSLEALATQGDRHYPHNEKAVQDYDAYRKQAEAELQEVQHYSTDAVVASQVQNLEETLRVLALRFRPAAEDLALDKWKVRIKEIEDDRRYKGLVIKPQFGLFPLERRETNDFFEFAHLYSGTLPERAADGSWFKSDDAAIVFVLIPPGTFQMGAVRVKTHDGDNIDPDAGDDEGPVHPVQIDAFFLAKYECTEAQWTRLERQPLRPRDPVPDSRKVNRMAVSSVSWAQCMDTKDINGDPVYGILPRYGLSLPTEAQWEYACRAGTTTRFWSGNRDSDLAPVAWAGDSPDVGVHAVGDKPPNPWGLFDMHGNVSEWCEDSWHSNYEGAPSVGSAWVSGNVPHRVLRGGSWGTIPRLARSAYRVDGGQWIGLGSIGFRVAASLSPR